MAICVRGRFSCKFSFWGIGGLSYVAILESDKKSGQNLYGINNRDSYFNSNVGVSGFSHTYLFKRNAYLKTNIGISGQYNNIITNKIDSSFNNTNFIIPEYRQETQNIRYTFNSTFNKKFNSRDFFNIGINLELCKSSFVDSINNLFGKNTFITLRNYKGSTSLLRSFSQWQHKFSDNFLFGFFLSSRAV